jgi:hypothetical protein
MSTLLFAERKMSVAHLFFGFMVRLALKEKPASINLPLENYGIYYDAQEGGRHSDDAALPSRRQ